MLVPKTASAKEKTNLRPRGFSIASSPLFLEKTLLDD